MTIRTRFSPSPTGMIHLGNARAALFSALYAAKASGIFILRIEDTDATRSAENYAIALQEDLRWLGVDWQEGPGVGGEYGPYWQSQRQAIYATYYQLLEKAQAIYPCFCSDQELLVARKLQLSRGLPPRYAGTCRKLSQEDIAMRIANGKKPAWRYHVPADRSIEFVDVVKGPQLFKSDDIGDFIVRRADGTAPFLFCNAIDDAMMKVTHVLRGEDHLANTPRQILLLQALHLSIPHYGHLSLIVGDDGAPLSKRHGSFSLSEMHENGYLPLAVINYLVRLGHTCDSQALLPFNLLATHFYLEKLSRSPARFDKNQLLYWQKTAVQALTIAEFWLWLGEDIAARVPADKRTLFAETIKANVEFPQDALTFAQIFFEDEVRFDEENLGLLQEAGVTFFATAIVAIEQHGLDLQAVLNELKQTLSVQGKKLFMPLRIALTGKIHGPELAQIATLLGQQKMMARLVRARELAKSKVT